MGQTRRLAASDCGLVNLDSIWQGSCLLSGVSKANNVVKDHNSKEIGTPSTTREPWNFREIPVKHHEISWVLNTTKNIKIWWSLDCAGPYWSCFGTEFTGEVNTKGLPSTCRKQYKCIHVHSFHKLQPSIKQVWLFWASTSLETHSHWAFGWS